MKYLIDTHCHSLASGHAYSTIQEIAKEANNKGLKMVAITDHGPLMPGGSHIFYIANQRVIPNKIHGVEILKGVEANIIDYDGNLDIPERIIKALDFVIASLHDVCLEPGNIDENTRGIMRAMENPFVDAIAHPGNPNFPIHMETVVLKAKETDTLIEINNSSLQHKGSRAGSLENCINIAKLCKEHNVSITVGSDAHISFAVGKFDKAIEILSNINMPKELIMNLDPDKFKHYLQSKGKIRFMESSRSPKV